MSTGSWAYHFTYSMHIRLIGQGHTLQTGADSCLNVHPNVQRDNAEARQLMSARFLLKSEKTVCLIAKTVLKSQSSCEILVRFAFVLLRLQINIFECNMWISCRTSSSKRFYHIIISHSFQSSMHNAHHFIWKPVSAMG